MTDEPTEGIQLDCASSEHCTPRILASVSGLHSVFVLAIPLPSNLTTGRFSNLTNIPLNQSGVDASALNSTGAGQVLSQLNQTANQAVNQTSVQTTVPLVTTVYQQQAQVQPNTGDEIIGLVFLVLVFLFFLAIVRGIYKAIKARLAAGRGGGSAGSGRSASGGGSFAKGGVRQNSGKRQSQEAEEEEEQPQQRQGGEDLRILKVRYAKGEITKKQFDRMRKDLE